MKKPTREEFIERLKKDAPDWELLGEYTNALTQTMFRHKPCGTEYMKLPYSVTHSPHSCRACNSKKLAFTAEQYREKVAHKTDYELLTDYTDRTTKVKIRHKICGTVFETLPFNFSSREEGCPKCKNKLISRKTTLTEEEFWSSLGDKAKEYELLSPYKNMHTAITVRHKVCGNEFKVLPSNFTRGSRCKRCKYSTGEGEVYNFVKTLLPGLKVYQGNRTILPNKFELDVWVPELKIAIEYDGLAYHSIEHLLADENRNWTEAQAIKFHLWKTEECMKRGIRLIHIFEDEWIQHREIVEDKLMAVFKTPLNRYYARQLEVKEVNKKEANAFLDANHIQEHGRSTVCIGLYDGDALVAVQTFLKTGNGTWDLDRYATLLGTHIIGGFTKCLKYFERNYDPKQLRTFGDRRWCSPFTDVYKETGFTLDGVTAPTYWYIKGNKRYHKSNFRKKKLAKMGAVITGKTEKEIMHELKYQRIYDCGLYRYIKVYDILDK